MATKTISIDTEAYGRLKARKKEGESFSEAIKRLVPAPFDGLAWLESLAEKPFSDQFIANMEEVIASRRAPENMRGYDDDLSGHKRADRSGKIKAKSPSPRRRAKNKRVASSR